MQQTDTVQQAEAGFFAPVALAYLAACGLWFLARLARPAAWDRRDAEFGPPARPWVEGLIALLVLVAILGLGQLWREDLLLPRRGGLLLYNVNQAMIWSPLFLALWWRKQSLTTVYLSARGLPTKIATGLVLAVIGTWAYLALRGELDSLGGVLLDSLSASSLGHLLPVFLEAVGLVYLFERLRWCLGTALGIFFPCLVFALAHVPGAIEAGRSTGSIAAFFAFNTLLPMAILFTVWRSRDVVWIGIVHFLMDVAIEAFPS